MSDEGERETGAGKAAGGYNQQAYDHYSSMAVETGEAFERADERFQKYLYLTNAGGLLITFTIAGVLVQEDYSIVPLLVPAFAFALGLIAVGVGAMSDRFNMKKQCDLAIHRMNEYLSHRPDPGPETVRFDAADAWLVKCYLASFGLFLAGVGAGFYSLSNL